MDWWRRVARELRRRPALCDGLLAAALTAIDLGWLVAQRAGRTVDVHLATSPVVRHVELLAPIGTALVVAQTLPLVARRRSPVVVLFLVGTSRVAYDVARFHDAPQPLGVLVALYTVASLAEGSWRRVVPAVTVVGLAISMTTNPVSDIPVEAALNGLLLGAAWVLGDNVRTRRAYLAEVEARVEQVELTHHAVAARAALEERARIARELHDLVAHHLSVIAVQSEAAVALLPVDSVRAAQALVSVRSTASEALNEMRQLLGVLRGQPDAELAPQPGLADLDRLFGPLRDAGLPVTQEVVGTARSLPAPVELTCYRVVQEALTNALRHAEPSEVRVRVDWRNDGIALEVSDDGRAAATGEISTDQAGRAQWESIAEGAGGHGLVGMRERVAMIGGCLTAGARPGEGFVVSAWIPTSAP